MKKYLYFIFVFIFILAGNFLFSQNKKSSKISGTEIIESTINDSGLEAAIQKFNEIKTDTNRYSFREKEFNALGYAFLGQKLYKEALAVFKMNTELFPNSGNVYDSYAEGFLLSGEKEKARENYKLAVEKDANNRGSKFMLENLDDIFTRYSEEKEKVYKPGEQTGIKGPYLGQTPPGKEPKLFAKGIISKALSSDYACTFSPDGKEIYFTRALTMQELMVSRLEKEGWTYPEPVSFSNGYSAHEPHITFDNKKIFWGWFRPGPGETQTDGEDYGIYFSKRIKNGWSEARYAGQGMYVSSDKKGKTYITWFYGDTARLAEVIFKEEKIADYTPLKGMENVKKISGNIAHPCIAPDGSYIVYDIEGGEHLFVSFKDKDDTWSNGIDLALHGLDKSAGIASISPDGKYLFFENKRDLYWVSTKLIEDLKSQK
jgi:hypothetical protein